MATVAWEGGAAPVAQVNTFAFAGTWEADDLIRVIAGNKSKDFTAGSTVTATVVSTLDTAIDALDADVYPEINSDESGVTASSVTTTLTLTANEAGVPFTISLTPLEANGGAADAQTIEGAGTVTTGTAATANAGPNVWGTARNWDTAAAPVAGDTVHIDGRATDDILYGISQAGATITAMHIWQSYEGKIGLPTLNDLGVEYPEYRDTYLVLDVTTMTIGAGPGNGSGRIKWNAGAVQTAVTVHNTGNPEGDDPALIWKGTHASNTMTIRGNSSVGVAIYGGEAATIATLLIEGNAQVRCGVGTTLTTVTVNGGTVELNSAVTTLTVKGGTVTINGAGAVTTLVLQGGTVIYNTTGTLGTLTISGDGVIDFEQHPANKTLTNPIELHGNDCKVLNKTNVANVGGGGSLVVDYNQAEVGGQVEMGSNTRATYAATA